MSYCSHCGAEVHDEAIVCVKCGCAIKPQQKQSDGNDTLLVVAKVFMIIACVITPAFGLLYGLIFLALSVVPGMAFVGLIIIMVCALPLAWCLPLTITVSNKIKNQEPIGIGIKICTLIFVNLIAGILLLCHYDD